MSNVWGKNIKVSIFGESHGEGVGITLGGLPAGLEIDIEEVVKDMKRRAPGQDETATERKEADEVKILTGFLEGQTTGAPLCGFIFNTDTRSQDYKTALRPGHSDMTAFIKYNGKNDFRGGGHFSGRLTAPLVFAGSVAKEILKKKNIYIGARILSVENIYDETPEEMTIAHLESVKTKKIAVLNDEIGQKMREAIVTAKNEGDSVGGVLECYAFGLPVGLGDPFFESMESSIASFVFSIPAVKGIEFGKGFEFAKMRGSDANDPLQIKDGVIKPITNNNGGILGGITNGLPIITRVCFKPTSSISKEQKTVDRVTLENVTTSIKGRHDPCIAVRAVPVLEAAIALCILDKMLPQF